LREVFLAASDPVDFKLRSCHGFREFFTSRLFYFLIASSLIDPTNVEIDHDDSREHRGVLEE
jgi:hypothetical protein